MLLGLPEKTEIKKIVSKKQIYEKYLKEFNSNRKRSFNDEIEKITFINEISKYSVNCEEGKEVKRIFVIKIDLRKEKFSDENISLISKLFNQKIIFILNNENKIALAIYQDKLFKTKFDKKENFTLKIEGLNLDRIWENFVLSISGYQLKNENNLKEQIDIETKKEKLIKEIEVLEKQVRKEIQTKKAFELHKKIRTLKNELINL
ncbi:DUF4391 domain-containing protein [Fusobacterium sp.]|jgi:hypothetical protein|uniref:DUF4391 domain-containing protein n=1 Tax=Fusobacterium sp. TaxID=68766 RepID=UPI002A83F997|nr:DUF4391 domain-containing protein [Fusobacterium sp.]